MKSETDQTIFRNPWWFLLLAGLPLFMGFFRGPLFIDDAYITFRYAANLAAGRGFVYNAAPILGTTAPLYCLLLAAAGALGISIVTAAFMIGVMAGGIAPVLVWRSGLAMGRPAAGFLAGLVLALFPYWWLNSKTGMETSLAGALVMAAILLDLKDRPAASGLVCALLTLTRPDTAALPVLLFLARLVGDKRGAKRFAVAGALGLLPWAVYGFMTFGSPQPQSLAAKQLIHYFPWYKSLWSYLSWFGAVNEPRAMILMAAFWMAGAVSLVRSRRAVSLALWPAVFLLGLSLTQVGPFFWYKIPLVPVFFLTAAAGFEAIYKLAKSTRLVRPALVLAPAVFIAVQLAAAWPLISGNPKMIAEFNSKEKILGEMAQAIRARTKELGLQPSEVKVYVGETGVIGYELLDFQVIDSAGINSQEVYEIRKADWERFRETHHEVNWKQQWGSTPEWSREVIRRFSPRFIASDTAYLHLQELARDPDFSSSYLLLRSWKHSGGHEFVVLEKRAEGK